MKVRSTDFRVEEGHEVNLDKWPTALKPIYESKKQYQKLLRDHVDELRARPEIIESTSDRVNIEFTTVFSYHIWWL
jgi:hypothetical protein